MSRSSRSKRIENDVEAEDISGTKDLAVLPSFEAMGLKEDLLRGVYGYGFERPSAIQQRAIKPISYEHLHLHMSNVFVHTPFMIAHP